MYATYVHTTTIQHQGHSSHQAGLTLVHDQLRQQQTAAHGEQLN